MSKHRGTLIRYAIASIVVAAVAVAALVLAPEALAASGNDVGQNLGSLLRRYAAEIYAGVPLPANQAHAADPCVLGPARLVVRSRSVRVLVRVVRDAIGD
jgi:hypothetical protein